MMKQKRKIIYLFLVTALFYGAYGCANKKVEGDTKNTVNWTSLTYNYQTGSVAPEFFYSYTLNIESNGAGSLAYHPTYGNENIINYNFKLRAADLKKIEDALLLNKAFEMDIPSVPDVEKPEGGDMDNMRVMYVNPDPKLDQPPRMWQTPDYPVKEYAGNLSKLYFAVRSSVPDSIWADTKLRKEEFQKSKQ